MPSAGFPPGGLRVALVNEGTYPYAAGGVSVWCDYLVRGLAEHEFVLTTLVATGRERATWQLPGNVAGLRPFALWGSSPPGRRTRQRVATRAAMAELAAGIGAPAVSAAPTVSAVSNSDGPIERALRSLLSVADRAGDTDQFHAELRDGALAAQLLAAGYHAGGRRHPVSASDAISAATLIERALLVLAADPGEVDLVHAAANGPAALVGLAANWRRGTPFVISEHGIYLRERYLAMWDGRLPAGVRRLVAGFLRGVVGACYARAELVLPVSSFNRRWALRHGAHPDRLITVFNGVDQDRYPPLEDEPAEPAIAWIGRIDPLKDLETLIRAFRVVRDERPEVALRLFGPCPAGNERYHAHCESLVARLDLRAGVRFEGPVRGSRPAFAAGQLVALSSISEGMPYTVIEAMMSGRSTVNTDVGGVREAVGDAGLVVPPRDPQAFGVACLGLLRDRDRRQRLGRAARDRALSMFTLEESTDCYRLLYQSAAGSRGDVAALGVDRVAE